MAKFNGQGGTLSYSSTTISVLDWKIDYSDDEINTTSTGDGGYHTGILAVKKIEGTFKVDLDTTSMLTGIISASSSGQLVATLGSSTRTITIPTINVTKATVDNPAEDAVSYEISFVSSGSFTWATT